MGPLGRVHVLDAEQITVVAGDEEYMIDLPLVGEARERATVGRLGDDLVVQFAGVHRWLPLPPLLRRCRPTHAVRTPQGLRIAFAPDAALWRSDATVAS
jgi:arsenite-transporting ATPase